MASRYRFRSIPTSGSYISIVNGVYQSTSNYSAITSIGEIWDEVGSVGQDHVLTVKKLEAGLLEPITGACSSGSLAGSHLTAPCYGNLLTTANSHLSVAMPSIGQEVTKLLARTNPSRPSVNPLTLGQDIIDIPKQLKGIGDLLANGAKGKGPDLIKDGTNQFFSNIFGWAPLIEDVKKLLEFQSTVHKRAQELNRLYDRRGLKRRLRLGTYGASSTNAAHIATSYPACIVQGNLSKFTKVERWGTVRWRPNVRPRYRPGEKELIRQARRIVGGLSVEGMTQGAWDLIPWTWVIDWFADIGSFMKITSNAIPATAMNINIMTHTVTWTHFRPTFRSPGFAGGDGSVWFETKERSPNPYPSPQTSIKFLSGRQLSILGALALQRAKR